MPTRAPYRAPTLILATILLASAVATGKQVLHVAQHHSALAAEHHNGTVENPFVSLKQAREHIISLRRSSRFHDHIQVVVHKGWYAPLHLDQEELSHTSWVAAPGQTSRPVISGGINVPPDRFKPWESNPDIFVASLANLGVNDLGRMVSGNCVSDCQHDKVGVTYNGGAMTLARWPNVQTLPNGTRLWVWSHATVGEETYAGFSVDTSQFPDANRVIRWAQEKNAYVHGYWQWDWADCYGRVTNISRQSDEKKMIQIHYEGAPNCKPWARWMGVNLLCELDQPGEYFIDPDALLLYIIPPKGEPPIGSSEISLMHEAWAVVLVTSPTHDVTVRGMEVRNGRHAGVVANATSNVTLAGMEVHAHGTHGIVMDNVENGVIRGSNVFDVGCSGIRTTGGNAPALKPGNMTISGNNVTLHAQWKRTYQPGIFWSGVGNRFEKNIVRYAPHNCFLGGGDFGHGVDNLFEGNLLADCTFETLDSGGFYTCGQQGTAFVNRGNVLRGNTFLRVRNTAGYGVQRYDSNQAVYLDDQMSGWRVENNTFTDCQVGSFIGGGRRNLILNNRFIRCGTVQYVNAQGIGFDKRSDFCSTIAPPEMTDCNPGAAQWMTSRSPAASQWATRWPEMLNISSDFLGLPAHSMLINNTYCDCPLLTNVPIANLTAWKVLLSGNREVDSCHRDGDRGGKEKMLS